MEPLNHHNWLIEPKITEYVGIIIQFQTENQEKETTKKGHNGNAFLFGSALDFSEVRWA